MTLLSFQDGERFIASSSALLQEAGITLTVGYDFAEYKTCLLYTSPSPRD